MWGFQLSCWVCMAIRVFLIWRSLKTANATMMIGSLAALIIFYVWCAFRQKTGSVHVTKSWELQ
jgi:uncharacterized membrane protein YbhN (UPF0104 family)